MVFIRAPIIESVGKDVEVLAEDAGHPVLVQQGRILASTFHPELTSDTTVHAHTFFPWRGNQHNTPRDSSPANDLGIAAARKF